MEYGTFRGVVTLVILVLFIGIVVWAYSSRRKKQFDEAANLVFDDDDTSEKSKNQESKQ
ncbi:cbb3-type cytochrome oxidase subunit 3 [Gallaecimonas sp. GXIMD1310]|uniref:cbb3-type cytochrome oxidase subunit 3 n=1 Tax=Gallaecimonas sp. GXIMD1310 TaxID=3131926 RepID=UPI003252B922